MNIKNDILWRVYISYTLIAVFAMAVMGRAIQIQSVQGKHWSAMADSLTRDYVNVEAIRGNIYSTDGSLMATSFPEYEIRMDVNADPLTDKIFYNQIDSLGFSLSLFFKDKSAKEYVKKLKKARKEGERYVLIRNKVSYTELKHIKKFPIYRLGKYKGGLIVIQKNKRVKPFQELASRTIGYTVDGVKPVGLEGTYDKELGGERGKRLMQKISGGVWIPINDEDEIAPKDGMDIMSTIDINIQDVAHHALEEQLILSGAHHGCVVLMEVATGEIRAISNLTRIDSGVYRERYNYAVGESVEPGSTFKLASYMIGFEDGKFGPMDTIDTQGGKIRFYNHITRDSHEGGYGVINMQKAFAVSSNVAIAKAINNSYKSDPQRYVNYLKKLKLHEPLGLDIPGEGSPLIRGPKDKGWSGLSLTQMSIGYEVQLTPLQILTFYNAVANNGKMIKPLFVKELRNSGVPFKTFEAKVINKKICSDETLEMMKKMLELVVEKGTATNLSTTVYKIAGKTGTAQVAGGKNGYKVGGTIYNASFCGYFPAENPKYSIIVVINDPSKKAYYGSLVSGPVFKKIADKVYASSMDMHKSVEQEYALLASNAPVGKAGNKVELNKVYEKIGVKSQSNTGESEWVSVEKNSTSVKYSSRTETNGIVPDVTGMGLRDALYLLENAGLKTKISGSGKVIGQSLAAGSKIYKGTLMSLTLK